MNITEEQEGIEGFSKKKIFTVDSLKEIVENLGYIFYVEEGKMGEYKITITNKNGRTPFHVHTLSGGKDHALEFMIDLLVSYALRSLEEKEQQNDI